MNIVHKKDGEAPKLREAVLYHKATKNYPLTRKELSAILRCSVETISAMVTEGMPCIVNNKVQKPSRGNKPRFIYRDCLNWLTMRDEKHTDENEK